MEIRIYTLSHPITKQVRYVGLTKNELVRRLSGHKSEAKQTGTKRACWIRSLMIQGLEPVIEELELLNCTWEEACVIELYWIVQFRAWGFDLMNSEEKWTNGTAQENASKTLSKTVYQYTKEGNLINEFKSAREAERQTGICFKQISSCCTGSRTSGKGFVWSFDKREDIKWKKKPKSSGYKVKGKRTVYQYTKDLKFINMWDKVTDAAEETGIHRACIEVCATGKRKIGRGFIWTYEPIITEDMIIKANDTEQGKKAVALVDGDVCAYRIGAMTHEESEWKIVKFEMDYYLKEVLLRPVNATHYMGFFTGGNNFRKQIVAEFNKLIGKETVSTNDMTKLYKGSRTDTRPKWYKDIQKYLCEEWGFVFVEGQEADDALAIVQKKNSILLSNDHDFRQVPGMHYDYTVDQLLRQIKIITPEEAYYNLWKQIITGCNTDEVEGIRMYGDKKASDYLANFKPLEYPEAVKNLYEQKYGVYGELRYNLTVDLITLGARREGFIRPELREVKYGEEPIEFEKEEDEF